MAEILIVDDDPHARLLVTTLLRHAGHGSLEAADGVAALRLAAEHRPDLIVVDLSMPTMNGAEFIRKLRADPSTRDLRVALYSATAMDAATRDFMEIYGVVASLPKPSEPHELLAAVEAALQRQSRISGRSSP